MAIDCFDKKYAFLSNFYNIPVTYNGYTFRNNESAFQAMKDPSRIKEFINLEPNIAKRLGRKVTLRSDWDTVKDDVMYSICKAKFTQNPKLTAMLLATGDEELIEGNYWNDTYWGVCKGKGENRLGKILMKIRNELKGYENMD